FRFFCRGRAQKIEKKTIFYACLARVVREGGFKVALISRYSAIPGHVTTALYSTCGLGFWIFLAAAVLSLPKQLALIAIGMLAEESDNASGTTPKHTKIISWVVVAITVVITVVAYRWILRQMNDVKPVVIYERRKARYVSSS
ncbi:hypothetical protein PUNSTDRAFT_77185, partial [Punctularia strigosozonata HHB-11173 SS5]